MLYKLHDASIANYKRNKDPETQWFTYTWRFEKEEYIEKITEFHTKRLNERESAEYEFYCPVCDYELEPYDAEAEKKLLKREISKDKRNFKKIEAAINE